MLLSALFYSPQFVYPESLPSIKIYAIEHTQAKFGPGQWTYFNIIINRESRWISTAQNPTSSAYGLGQFLNSTWAMTSYQKTSDPYIQIDATLEYIGRVYGTPKRAKEAQDRKHWY